MIKFQLPIIKSRNDYLCVTKFDIYPSSYMLKKHLFNIKVWKRIINKTTLSIKLPICFKSILTLVTPKILRSQDSPIRNTMRVIFSTLCI